MINLESQPRWLYNHVQEDLEYLQNEFKHLGYDFTKELCYDIWYSYSEKSSANWLKVRCCDLALSLKSDDLELALKDILTVDREINCSVKNSCKNKTLKKCCNKCVDYSEFETI